MDPPATPTTPSAPRIRIDDNLEKPDRVKSTSTTDEWPQWKGPDIGSSTGVAGGIYYGRDLTRVGSSRRLSQAVTRDSTVEVEESGDDWRRDDGRKKQVFTGTTLMWYVDVAVL